MTMPTAPPSTVEPALSTALTALAGSVAVGDSLYRLAERDGVEHQARADQEVLRAVEDVGQLGPERGGLLDERRNHREADERHDCDEERVDGENRDRARDAAAPAGEV